VFIITILKASVSAIGLACFQSAHCITSYICAVFLSYAEYLLIFLIGYMFSVVARPRKCLVFA